MRSAVGILIVPIHKFVRFDYFCTGSCFVLVTNASLVEDIVYRQSQSSTFLSVLEKGVFLQRQK